MEQTKAAPLLSEEASKLYRTVGRMHTVFSCPEVKPSAEIGKADPETTLKVLRAVIGALDPTLRTGE